MVWVSACQDFPRHAYTNRQRSLEALLGIDDGVAEGLATDIPYFYSTSSLVVVSARSCNSIFAPTA